MQHPPIDRAALEALVRSVFETTAGNILTEENAIRPEFIGLQLFDAPILKIGAADDPLFDELKREDIVGPWHRSPKEWMENAKSVIALFFPFTEAVRASNRVCTTLASEEWMQARIEGQFFQNAFLKALAAALEQQGVAAHVPGLDPAFRTINEGKPIDGYGTAPMGHYSSYWSERHVSYVCGLGTFCLSRGLISEKGVAGRYSTLLTDLPLAPDARPYTGVYDYCTNCGVCAARCPAGAIDPVKGKNHTLCNAYVKSTERPPRYGCGLCQVGVPCETCIPNA